MGASVASTKNCPRDCAPSRPKRGDWIQRTQQGSDESFGALDLSLLAAAGHRALAVLCRNKLHNLPGESRPAPGRGADRAGRRRAGTTTAASSMELAVPDPRVLAVR